MPAIQALLGVYPSVSALRGLFIGPGLDALAGMDGEIWTGAFDFTVLRPVDTQFLVSVRKWRVFALFDLLLGLSVLAAAVAQLQVTLTLLPVLAFLLSLLAGVLILYAILLLFAALIFWSPGVLFTWIFDGLSQMARYPLGMYLGRVRLVFTWMVPVGVITTIPAQALLLTAAASGLFRLGLRRYASAPS